MTCLVFELTHHAVDGRPIVRLTEEMTRIDGDPVPAGFETDFASIPWLARLIFAVFGRSCRASVGHDFDCNKNVAREIRSGRFLRQMLRDHVPTWQAYVQYWSVLLWPGSEAVDEPDGAVG